MKGIICYYSGSGNTKLACEYIKNRIKNADIELYNIVKSETPDLDTYDIVGFATFTDFSGPPQLMCTFLDGMKDYPEKTAFIFNTYGFISGKTLKRLKVLVQSKKFNIVAEHTLKTPESYPPQRKRGYAADDCPNGKHMGAFNSFITNLDRLIQNINTGQTVKPIKFKGRFVDLLLPSFGRTKAKKDFGIQEVNKEKCTECGVCAKGCPYEAITLDPNPVFDHEKCFGCWYCYNHCKSKAIFTPKFDGDFQYPKPIKELVEKLNQ